MYVNNFYKSQHNYDSFFTNYADNTALKNAKADMKAAADALNQKIAAYNNELGKRYNSNFTPTEVVHVMHYMSRKEDDYYFDAYSGTAIETPETAVTRIHLSTKNGSIAFVVGYCYELGAAIIRQYNYRVATNNSYVNLVFTDEFLYPIIEENVDVVHLSVNGSAISTTYIPKRNINVYSFPSVMTALERMNATEFIQEFYGVDKKFSLSLGRMADYIIANKSFEILIRTVEDDSIMLSLLKKSVDSPVMPYKIINSDKAAWKYAQEKGCLKQFVDFKDRYFSNNTYPVRRNRFEKVFNKTDIEWIDFLEKCAHWDEDLSFYGLGRDHAEEVLVEAYCGYQYPFEDSHFNEYYSFSKFCSYVVEECINQGYSSMDNFLRTLSDYLRMCKDLDVVPTLYSSYLSQTHDIVSRNHKISISEIQEKTFKNRYSEFKKFTTEDESYSIIAPVCSHDLRREGDALNHCVASYIKRVIDGSCLILFLRLSKSLTKSLVTLEIRDKAVVQARGLHNRDIDEDEKAALRQFCKSRKMTLKV